MRRASWASFAVHVTVIACALSATFEARAQPPASAVAQSQGAPQPPTPSTFVPAAPTADDYQALLQRLDAMERRIQQQARELRVYAEPADAHRNFADGKPQVQPPDARLTTLEKPVEQATERSPGPKFPLVRIGGFFQLDAGFFSQDAASIATLGDIQDGVGFRRARLQAYGSVAEFTNYSLEMDFAFAGRPSFMDVWGEQTHLPFFGAVRIGQFRQPFSMDAMTLVQQIEFLERSLPFQAFVPFRRDGIMAYDNSEDQMTTWAYSVYRTGGFLNQPIGDSRFATDIGDQGGFSFSGRVTHLLYYDEPAHGRWLAHVGSSYDYSRITGSSAGGNFYEARAIPEFFVGDPAGGGLTVNGTPFFVDTGRLASHQFNMWGLELAAQAGPCHFQAEYMATLVDQVSAGACFYDGAYAQVGWFLTGENRTYNRMFGVFDRVVPYSEFFSIGRGHPICGWGAWELTGRWSYVNLNSPNAVPILTTAGPPPSPNPGRLNDVTLGLNWYWNTYTKLQFNYINCFLDNATLGNSYTGIYVAMFQVEF